MDKQQLIESYNLMKQSLEPVEVLNKTIPTLTWVCIVIGVLILIWVIRGLRKSRPLPLNSINWDNVLFLIVLPVIVFFLLAYHFYDNENKPVVLTISEKISIETNWNSDVLQNQYLNNLRREKYEVMDYKFSVDKGVSVIIDTNKPISVIEDIRDIKWMDIEKPYIQSVWVEGLSDIGFNNQFYNTTLFMPKKEN
ncbi:hypothetical protein ACPV3A_14445 [Paenibacillus sp. Dod16]|uniref:hypothetical protein n=1 Tax=Paenibacillus sp. Dod16 TaxID=3416392 RepID=UPI003CF85B2C